MSKEELIKKTYDSVFMDDDKELIEHSEPEYETAFIDDSDDEIIKQLEKEYKIVFMNDIDKDKFIKLYKNNILDDEYDNKEYFNYIGIYYKHKSENEKALKFYIKAIEKGAVNAMYNLGDYYLKREDRASAKKYFKMGVDLGHIESMYELGMCEKDDKNYEMMEEYLIMASEKKHVESMIELGVYYENIGDLRDRDYFQSAIECSTNRTAIMNKLGNYYFNKNKFNIAKIYLNMSVREGSRMGCHYLTILYINLIDNGHCKCFTNLCYFDLDIIMKYKLNVRVPLKLMIRHYDIIQLYYDYIISCGKYTKYKNTLNTCYNFIELCENTECDDLDSLYRYYIKSQCNYDNELVDYIHEIYSIYLTKKSYI
jgi:tetratricopeptide (TPR) repeat protein